MDSTSQAAVIDSPRKPSFFWPEKLLGRRPGLKEVNVFCWAIFVVFLIVPLCAILYIQARHGSISVTRLHSDFVYFYGDGQMVRNYPVAKLYDYNLQQRVFNAIYPAQGGLYGPSPYPPFIPLFFEPFSYLSFRAAYLVWLLVSIALYLSGVGAAAVGVFPRERPKISLIFCFSIAFLPFLFGTLLNGQLASIAAFSVGLAVYEDKKGNPFYSGLALALLSYKVTLLLLLLPMLLLSRKFRTLLGFATGTTALVAVSTLFAGIGIWPAYLQILRYFGRISGLNRASRMTLWNHVDLKSFFAAIPGLRSSVSFPLLLCIVVTLLIAIGFLVWKAANGSRSTQWLVWATVLTWTLLINLYVPIYDSVLVVIAIILTLGALRDLGWSRAQEWTTLISVVLFVASWKTETFAKAHGIQLFTIMLIVLGLAQLWFLHRAIRQEKIGHSALTA